MSKIHKHWFSARVGILFWKKNGRIFLAENSTVRIPCSRRDCISEKKGIRIWEREMTVKLSLIACRRIFWWKLPETTPLTVDFWIQIRLNQNPCSRRDCISEKKRDADLRERAQLESMEWEMLSKNMSTWENECWIWNVNDPKKHRLQTSQTSMLEKQKKHFLSCVSFKPSYRK